MKYCLTVIVCVAIVCGTIIATHKPAVVTALPDQFAHLPNARVNIFGDLPDAVAASVIPVHQVETPAFQAIQVPLIERHDYVADTAVFLQQQRQTELLQQIANQTQRR